MIIDQQGRQFRLLTTHCVLSSLAMSLAGGFVGAYLLRIGFSVAAAIAINGILLAIRCAMRAALLPAIRRLGAGRALLVGRALMALQFLPLIHADRPGWLILWVLIVSTGECIYWPICHAAYAMSGGGGRRGWQIALRQIASTGVSVAGPMIGGEVLTQIGANAEFELAAILGLISATPLLWMNRLDLGRIPTLRQSMRLTDTVGLLAFVGDGWLSAGLGVAWPMVLFSLLGSSYDALGWASSVAALVGALAGLGCGIAIDRGYRTTLIRGVTAALIFSVVLRLASAWAPWGAFAANAFGAAVGGAYYPVLMSMIYDRAKRSESAYHFHLAAEVGWDAGAIAGCLASAAVACSGLPPVFVTLPSMLGIMLVHHCIRSDGRAQIGAVLPAT
jgi:hypothetical protein